MRALLLLVAVLVGVAASQVVYAVRWEVLGTPSSYWTYSVAVEVEKATRGVRRTW